MPLELRPATEADAAREAEIEALAYAPNPFNHILFPGPFPPGAMAARAAELAAELREDGDAGRWLKVVDTDLGEGAVAWARWHIYADSGRPRPTPRRRTFGPGSNVEACELLFDGIDEQKERLIGERPCVYPKHQGRGAGGMLVNWGIEEAKRRGLPAYLVSSEAGHPLYQKWGFRDLGLLRVDFSKWGATEKQNNWVMIYEPSA
ncbi:hypothetical protein SLS62_005592 [Diatrype stigma]|uniref:N-acetyltransferase domain-containing protein n=1 Tax=Diatrype stigma TaxID=117547 RepID=A0AAN9UNX2_9PEZI